MTVQTHYFCLCMRTCSPLIDTRFPSLQVFPFEYFKPYDLYYHWPLVPQYHVLYYFPSQCHPLYPYSYFTCTEYCIFRWINRAFILCLTPGSLLTASAFFVTTLSTHIEWVGLYSFICPFFHMWKVSFILQSSGIPAADIVLTLPAHDLLCCCPCPIPHRVVFNRLRTTLTIFLFDSNALSSMSLCFLRLCHSALFPCHLALNVSSWTT